ncbi:DNA polymerase zeta catalytic subunit [Habropoda laboriosa]|uniref:DNA polymerase zeta catalytic subunit n=1 Tax=Habropoda laboriosa TaxID=597456 RepID=A0A0L7QQV4_9HYME|nr:DNA polymerase zeta catalytic subunit [Habropoda laboriosa]
MFSINLVTLDSYQSTPLPELDVTFSNFRGNEIRQVPVIRIFGSTLSGIKTCLHIHGVFPYMYVPCTIDHNIDSFMYKLAAAIDSAINVSLGSATSNNQHVYKIQKVSGIPLYGYHEKEHLFFKIYLYNPAMIKRAAELLQNGTILGQSLQPHEAHIPFILQFMIDYNLYGMSPITLKNIKFRQCIYTESKENVQTESPLNLFDSQKYLPASVVRQSTCKLEVDAQASEILNKQEIQNGLDLNPGIAAIWNEENHRREAKGLENVESQLLYTNTNDRTCSPTENDIYQETKLIKRLASLSQISENVTPVTSKTLTYPLEVENEDNSFSASHVLNHFKPSLLNKESKNELLQLDKSMLKESLPQNEIIDSSIFDSEDMHLVEILAALAKENEEEIIVDNDSMLGSQFSTFSTQIKEDNEDDEIEDLNITSLDLNTFSSWNSVTNAASQSRISEIENKKSEDDKEKNYTLEHNVEDFSLIDVPQYDGPITENSTNLIGCAKSHVTINNVLSKLNVPSFDGNTVDSSSDSELDSDISINREEKRICIYKSCTKSKSEENVVNISLKKRKLEFEESNLQSPHKRHNTNVVSLQDKSHHTPTKVKTPQSPRCLSKKYSPLNVKIISPKPDRDTENNGFCNSKSTYATPKRNSQQLRMNLFREKISQATNIDETFLHNKHSDKTNTCKKFVDSGKEDYGMLETNIKTQKEVRKRLNFVNTYAEEIKSVNDSTVECHFENLSLTEETINDSCENNDSASNSIHSKHCIKICTRKDDKINCELNLPSTSKNNLDLYMDSVLNKTPLISDKDVNTEEEDTCNMTYTQYLSKKLESELGTPNVVLLQNTTDITKRKLITITTKFNPPKRERIRNSMQTYDISQSKFIVPYFSNKVDLIKERENSNKNNINDVVYFKCSLDRVTSIKLWRRVKINEFYPSGLSIKSCSIKRVLAGYNALVIHPLIHPPTLRNIKTWLQAKKYLLQKDNKPEKANDNIDIERDAKKSDVFNETSIDNQYILQLSQCSNNSQYSNGSSSSFNPSLRKMLENPLLYKNNDTQQHIGISYGQIEYSLKGHSGNVENENLQNARSLTVDQYLTLLSVEVHVITRDKFLPDPKQDSIGAIFYAVCNNTPLSSKVEQIEHGAIVVNSFMQNSKMKNIYSTSTICSISYVSSEKDLLNSLAILIRHCDPDILVGWEIEFLSWGYIFHRASHIGLNSFTWQISRISNVTPTFKGQTSDKDNFSDTKIPGRIILDVWRIMRHEVALLNYTFENVMYNVMRERISCPIFQVLTEWWNHKNITIQWRIITHYMIRVVGTLRILVHFDIIGDSVVSKGRETLERAIKIVESTPKWGAQVVYGDTDSLFILLRGKSRKEAFEIGTEIADTVTAANPPPVKLKFEKVLQPILLSILEKTLKILFDTKDMSLLKLYITRQFDKILRKKISIQDLTFAKEFRGLHGYKTSACVPALELTRRLIRKDPRAIPRTGERVRYVIVAGAPNQPLIQCVRTPMEVILDESLNPNSIYYITKVIIPPLNRCLNLIGIDVNTWYREMTHRQTPDKVVNLYTDNQKLTIPQFFSTVICAACADQTQKDICTNCIAKPNQTITILYEKIRWLERTHHELVMICQSCTGYLDEPKCESLDCPVLYRLMQARRDLVQIPYLNDIIHNSDTFCMERRNIR